MRVDDKVLKSVAFIGRTEYVDEKTNTWDGQALGTGFFVSIPSSINDRMFHCFVTGKHLLDDLSGEEPYIVLNRREGGKQVLMLGPNIRWWFHPSDPTADVAVMPFSVEPDHDIVSVGLSDVLLTEANRKRYRIGAGDEVFIVGLFTHAEGTSRNLPIVRQGNVAMMPEEKIRIDSGFADVYLIEARSIGGLSGAPVFVRETVAVNAKDEHGESLPMAGYGRLQLLGLMYGHWDIKESELNSPRFTPPGGRGVNLGIGIVVPATKIIETINQPELVEMRRKAEEDALKHRGAQPQSSALPESRE